MMQLIEFTKNISRKSTQGLNLTRLLKLEEKIKEFIEIKEMGIQGFYQSCRPRL